MSGRTIKAACRARGQVRKERRSKALRAALGRTLTGLFLAGLTLAGIFGAGPAYA